MSTHRLALAVVGLLIAGVPAAFAQRAAPATTELRRVIELSGGTQIVAADGQAGTPVAVSLSALAQAASDGGVVEVPLTPALTVRAQVAWTGADDSNTFVSGPLIDGHVGELNLTAVGDTLVGRIVVDGRLFMIRRSGDSAVYVSREIDQQSLPPEAAPLVPPTPPQPDPVPPAGAVAQDTNQYVDLLIVYTAAARAYMGGTANIATELNGAVTIANTALANSHVTHRFRLVHLTEIAYTEVDNDSDNLNRLTSTTDGFLDTVHALRETYRADVVTLIEKRTNANSCGIGWLLASPTNSGFEANAFNVVEVNCANANLSLAHEIGHNMGLHHDFANAGGGQGAFSYAYGYGVDGVGRTVMAYVCPTTNCSRRTIFSTPSYGFPSSPAVPAGTALANNALALENTSLLVANFRQAIPTCTYTLSATSFAVGQAAGIGTVGVTTQAGCAWTANSNTGFITVTGGGSGTGSGIVTYSFTANTGSPRVGTLTIALQTFTLTQGPIMTVNRTALSFGATNTGGTLTNITSSQAVTVTFTGASPAWTATTSTPWLLITGGSGTGAGQFTVSARSAAGLPATGTVTGSVSVGAAGAANTPQTVTVTLTLFASTATSAAPFGSFDTPASGSSVAGSIAVTGWALDDIEVTRVEIWRDRAAGEATPVHPGPGLGTGRIYIADALFINGARPDVEAGYPTAPYAYRAGWGYMMLTWGLWNQGNGPFTLYAFAYDRDGHATSLGSKAITVSNATATRPFGSIDVPTYGGTMSGVSYNFGWALTPNATPPCTIINGNVFVSVDSAPLTPVSYGDTRPDIQAGFPGFSNGSNAGGAYLMDTTTMSNGVHQIGWYVVDNCARAEGIGSRFFNVLNGGGLAGQPTFAKAAVGRQAVIADASLLDAPVEVRRGIESTLVYPGLAGDRVIAIGQSERVEVKMPHLDGARYTGYQTVNGERRALPLGSSLDAAQGIFYWQPAAGFLGSFQLEFVTAPDGAPVRVRAVVGTSVQAAIDTPQAGATAGAFTIAGWAIDLAATAGTGVDAVHVWAHPVTGASPIFLGAASYGEGRPDIGALFGAQFTGASFSLPVAGLAPGTYDVVVYPHSTVAGDFRGAQVVRVTVR
jgi:hypothetical protein